jgi:hypothetical protein
MATTRHQHLPLRGRVVAAILGVVAVVVAGQFFPTSVTSAVAACVGPVLDCTSGSISNGGVNLGRVTTTPGSSGSSSSTGGATRPGPSRPSATPLPSWPGAYPSSVCSRPARPVFCLAPVAAAKPAVVPATPAVTLTDLARFTPVTPGLISEPAGWAIKGLPANFIADEPIVTTSGALLGTTAQVRFTPVGFAWNFGDGSSASTATGGSTWAALGQSAFSATPTSHVYLSAGTFTVQVTVTLAATYQLGSGAWQSISGTLTRSRSLAIRVSASSAPLLVTAPCAPGNAAVGC